MRTPFAAKSLRDMALSVAVIMVPILLVMWFFTRPAQTPVNAVDWQGPLATARQQASYRVLAPGALPEGWTATRVRWTRAGEPGVDGSPSPGNVWMLGALGRDRVFYAVEQTDRSGESLVRKACRRGAAAGESSVAGGVWQRCLSDDGRTRVLWRTDGDATSVASADADWPALEAWVSGLRAG